LSSPPIPLRLQVQPQFDGWRLDHFLAARIPRLSRSRIQQMIRAQPELGGPTLRPASRVQAGREVCLLRPAPEEPEVPRSFVVLHQDEALLAIDKPAGLPVHATARFHKNTLTALLRERFEGTVPIMAHRLDRETSGLLLLGVTSAASIELKRAFRERRVEKRYLAIVYGQTPDEGVIDEPLAPDTISGIRVRMMVGEGGLPSRTRFRTRARCGAYSLVEASPETGRQHQIRAHLCAIGHPVVGDKLYGVLPEVFLEFIDTGWSDGLAARLLIPRHALHASSACFPHPATGEIVELHCPLARDLVDFWDRQGGVGLTGQPP
jgi:23S rRNA pseudouridine1911/1915/1917 synthase